MLANHHVKGANDQLGILDGVDGPPDDPATAGIHHAAAVDLPVPRRMFRDIADPEFVQSRSDESAFNRVITRGFAHVPAGLGRAWDPMDTSVHASAARSAAR